MIRSNYKREISVAYGAFAAMLSRAGYTRVEEGIDELHFPSPHRGVHNVEFALVPIKDESSTQELNKILSTEFGYYPATAADLLAFEAANGNLQSGQREVYIVATGQTARIESHGESWEMVAVSEHTYNGFNNPVRELALESATTPWDGHGGYLLAVVSRFPVP